MADRSFLDWPFLDDGHRAWARELDAWVERDLPALPQPDEHDLDAVYAACGALVRAMGAAGLLRACVPAAYGGLRERVDVRSLALARQTLAHAGALADFAFAMQGLGSVPVSLFGSEAQKQALLPGVCRGELVAAFALSEPDAGSDVAAMQATARRDGEHWVLDGTKTWISNAGGLADRYVVFARSEQPGDGPGSRDAKGISAFLVDADTPGLDASERIPVISPHPLGTLKLGGCRVGADRLIGAPGQGFAIAMGTLDLFRTTVGAAALGFARRALDEATARARSRRMFGQRLADFQLTQVQLGRMCTEIDAAALMVWRSAWTRDVLGRRVTREASMAKLYATEAAQQVIDAAVQLHGGLGVVSGQPVERLYRDVRALRIYEGATEVLQLVIGAQHLRTAHDAGGR
ncbi:acyl-CoA dehydrogenase family protein [Azohydromonas sp.]|uniref:acyl-CoA dehydrogenase family protein n=1 Tax=Azohydromonas sp. TaxID=1872666 RepID=UPI002CEEF8D2|nr:acyl-CoA dehydrogenase family protein [Azohydromonas sp.]HMM86659.1 acyl-CoA dehydrogenase family protein [Azohydromonas sp.]